ncbi:MAG: hypothetical protein WBG92_25765 [Thiohalocapsa sp.]
MLPVALLLALLLPLMLLFLRHFEYQLPQWLAEHPAKADSVLVEKAARRLSLIRDGAVYRSWRIALSGNPVGNKQREGDLRTPSRSTVNSSCLRFKTSACARSSSPSASSWRC